MQKRTFIVSDIHGDARHFRMLFQKLHIDLQEDFLYVNGDVLDRGEDSLRLFYELLELAGTNPGHLLMTKGNHELFAQYYLQGRLPGRTWSRFGGEDTLREVKALSAAERDKLIRYIRKFEKKELAGDRSDPEWRYCPSPEVKYQMHFEYLEALCGIMREKYNSEYVWGGRKLKDDYDKD